MVMWMVRSSGGRITNAFIERGLVAIGWDALPMNIVDYKSREDIRKAVSLSWPDMKEGAISTSVGQLLKFAKTLKRGDSVVTYDSAARQYYIGEIIGDHEYHSNAENGFTNTRSVKWDPKPISRDNLSNTTKNSLGSILTIFKVPELSEQELLAKNSGQLIQEIKNKKNDEIDESSIELQINSVQEKAFELIKDKVIALSWEDMQELVAGILRGMGYKTRISPSGSDRGKDIIASPDGLGFEPPRIVVEVKHRKGAMGSQEIRSFLGGRHKDDKGLYVSTGGFTKEAKYEAERANIPLTLIDIDDLVSILLENYEAMDTNMKTLIPISRIYWPAD